MRRSVEEAPFIFDLLRRNLTAEDQPDGGQQPISDRLAWLIMALAGSAALIYGAVSGVLSR